jgi:hypothetical protein
MSLEKFTENGFTVNIDYDPDVSDPRDAMSHGCELAMSHRRYTWPNDAGIDFDAFEGWEEIAGELRENHDALVVETVYAYDHSGVAFKVGERTGSFADPWDSGIAGLAYVTRQNWQDTQGTEWTGSDADLARAHELIVGDVKVYGQWANGECYGYVITDEYGEEVGSCCGFYGIEDVESEAKEEANALTHTVKCNGTLNRSTGTIEHGDTKCPLHSIAEGATADS